MVSLLETCMSPLVVFSSVPMRMPPLMVEAVPEGSSVDAGSLVDAAASLETPRAVLICSLVEAMPEGSLVVLKTVLLRSLANV